MNPLYRFVDVHCAGSGRTRSFTLHAGETRMLQLDSRDEKNAMIDCAIGEDACAEGSIEIPVAGNHANGWQPLSASRSGRVGWVAPNGGLISNLRIWENVTLPLWYRTGHEVVETEQRVVRWLGVLGVEQDAFEEFMAAHPHSVELWQRKLAGLLRALVHKPDVLVVDAALFGNIRENFAQNWIAALGAYAAEGGAVLAISDKAVALTWERIE